MRVVAACYRLAPEHAFPAAVDDAEAVYRALLANHAPDKIGLYGTSAGACLCAQLLVRLRETEGSLPRALIAADIVNGEAIISKKASDTNWLIVHDTISRTGDSEFFFRPPGDPSVVEDQFSAYLKGCDRLSPQVSPMFSSLTGLPPTLCISGTRDFMLSQTSLFHQALLRAGVDARLLVYEAMPHAHWIYLDLPESDHAFVAMADFFKNHLGR